MKKALVTALATGLSIAGLTFAAAHEDRFGAIHKSGPIPNPTVSFCFETPESCGFPGPNNSGAKGEGLAACAGLTASGTVFASEAKQKVENKNITGNLVISANEVSVKNVCVSHNGGGLTGSDAVQIETSGTNATLENVTIHGKNAGSEADEEGIRANTNPAGLKFIKLYVFNCGECIHGAAGATMKESYVITNAEVHAGPKWPEGEIDHYEAWYYNNSATVTVEKSTLLNPHGQTAIMFGDNGGACSLKINFKNNLAAGGGYMFYPCGNSTSVGTSSATITGNKLGRCVETSKEEPSGSGGHTCEGHKWNNTLQLSEPAGDKYGYYPNGGFFGVASFFYTGAGQTWEANTWLDNGETVIE